MKKSAKQIICSLDYDGYLLFCTCTPSLISWVQPHSTCDFFGGKILFQILLLELAAEVDMLPKQENQSPSIEFFIVKFESFFHYKL